MTRKSFRPPDSDAERAADNAAALIWSYIRGEQPLNKLRSIGIRVKFDFNNVGIAMKKITTGLQHDDAPVH